MILTLDIATTSGYAFGEIGAQPPLLQWGVRDFGGGRGNGEIVSTFRTWLNQRFYEIKPTLCVFETPYVPVGPKPGGGPKMNPLVLRRLLGMTAAIEAICFELRVECREVVSASFTKFVTGKGQYKTRPEKKAAVIAGCRHLGCDVKDDNEADALAIWFFAEGIMNPLASEQRRRFAADRERELNGEGPLFTSPKKENAPQAGTLRGVVQQPQEAERTLWSKMQIRI